MNNPINTLFDRSKYLVKVRHIHGQEAKKYFKKKYVTLCWVYDRATGELLANTRSECSRKDTPSRKLGLDIALHRAYKAVTHV